MVTFTSLFSGSRKNAALLTSDDAKILIDCGGNLKAINSCLETLGYSLSDITHIFITHSHNDHTAALKHILNKYDIKVYSSLGTHEEIYDSGIDMSKENRIVLYPDTRYTLGSFEVSAFNIPHDTQEPFGYNFRIEGKTFTYATDIGYIYDGLENKIEGKDLLFFESNHDIEMLKRSGRPPYLINRILGKKGHLCNDVSAGFTANLVKNGLKRLMLGHLSNDANTVALAYETTCNCFSSCGLNPTEDIEIYVAERDKISTTIVL